MEFLGSTSRFYSHILVAIMTPCTYCGLNTPEFTPIVVKLELELILFTTHSMTCFFLDITDIESRFSHALLFEKWKSMGVYGLLDQ